MNAAVRHALFAAGLLAAFALVGVTLVAVTEDRTRERIAENERLALLAAIAVLVDPSRYDNDPLSDTTVVTAPTALGTPDPVTVYRARRGGERVAVVFGVVAPDGYSGAIRMLVAINADGTVSGVRVIAHRETPGLGDGIEAARSDWILAFDGRSLDDPPADRWTVRRDGGVFDQFTGATITPRAVIRAVRRALEYYHEAGETLWSDHRGQGSKAPFANDERNG